MRIAWQTIEGERRFGWITMDGNRWRKVLKRLFSNRLKDFCNCSTPDELEVCFSALERKLAYSEALRLLGRRSRLAVELEQKLGFCGFSSESIAAAVEKCLSQGYLDDQTELYRRVEHLVRRGFGPGRIAYQLRQVDPELLRTALARLCTDPIPTIRALVEKRYAWKDLRGKHKAIRALLRRGFSLQTIYIAIQKFES